MAVQRAVLGRCGGGREHRSNNSPHTPSKDLLAMTAVHVDPVIPPCDIIPIHSVGGGDVHAMLAQDDSILHT